MAARSPLNVIDDIAALPRDVALMSKVAQETAGVPGDDLALSAQPVSGVQRLWAGRT